MWVLSNTRCHKKSSNQNSLQACYRHSGDRREYVRSALEILGFSFISMNFILFYFLTRLSCCFLFVFGVLHHNQINKLTKMSRLLGNKNCLAEMNFVVIVAVHQTVAKTSTTTQLINTVWRCAVWMSQKVLPFQQLLTRIL